MTIDWHRPARFDQELDVEVRLERLGSSSFTLGFVIVPARGGEALVSATTVYVNVDPDTQRSRPIPQDVRERMTSHATKELVSDGH
jgi:acyl-CoA thioester hydrolase